MGVCSSLFCNQQKRPILTDPGTYATFARAQCSHARPCANARIFSSVRPCRHFTEHGSTDVKKLIHEVRDLLSVLAYVI